VRAAKERIEEYNQVKARFEAQKGENEKKLENIMQTLAQVDQSLKALKPSLKLDSLNGRCECIEVRAGQDEWFDRSTICHRCQTKQWTGWCLPCVLLRMVDVERNRLKEQAFEQENIQGIHFTSHKRYNT